MELTNLNMETKVLIMNSLGIYHALQNQSKLYRRDGIASLSLYVGALRLGKSVTITRKEPIGMGPGTGYPYLNGIRPNLKDEKIRYQKRHYNYENVVCHILNEYGITIEQVIEVLNLNKKLSILARYSTNEKIERQYNIAYKTLLETIRNYYVASVKESSANNKNCNPLIDMNPPTIISAIHYPNIDPSNSIASLYSKLKGVRPDYLEKMEQYVTYEEDLCRQDEKGQLKLYRVKKPLVMNENIGKII